MASWLLVVAGLAMVVVEVAFDRDSPRSKRVLLICIGLTVAAAAGWRVHVDRQEQAKAATTGVLDLVFPSGLKCFRVGPTGFVINFDPKGQTRPAYLFVTDPGGLRVGVTVAGEVVVEGSIRDSTGNVIVSLFGNEWQVPPGGGALDRNYNDRALEVVDRTGDVVLQLRAVGDCLEYQYKLYFSTGEQVGMVDLPDDWMGAEFFRSPPGVKAKAKIKPLFKYPSARHLGELISPPGEAE